DQKLQRTLTIQKIHIRQSKKSPSHAPLQPALVPVDPMTPKHHAPAASPKYQNRDPGGEDIHVSQEDRYRRGRIRRSPHHPRLPEKYPTEPMIPNLSQPLRKSSPFHPSSIELFERRSRLSSKKEADPVFLQPKQL
ncbi:MAG: hypothetical protein ACNA71_10015, partial [Kiritimatiellia bacterium]